MQPQNPLPPNHGPLPDHISSVDQKIFEEYSRLNPIDPKALQGSMISRAAYWTADMWRYNKKVFIPAVGCLVVVLIAVPSIMLAKHPNNKQVATNNTDSTPSYYTDEGQSSDSSDTSGNQDNSTSIPSAEDAVAGTQPSVLDSLAPSSPAPATSSDGEAVDPEPIETGGPVVEPPVPEDPGTTPPPDVPDTPTGRVAGVNIVTFNYQHGAPASGIDDAVRKLSDTADIVGFQEFGPASHRDALNRVVTNCTSCGYALYMPDINNGGNVPIIWKKSKFQVISKGHMKVYDGTTVEDGAGGTHATAKHIIWVRLKEKSTGRVFWMANNHLIPTVESDGRPIASNPKRLALYRKHINALADKVTQFKSNGKPVFVTGDFNVNYRRDSDVKDPMFPYSKMGSVGMWANWRNLGVLDGGTQGSGNRLIDYVFSSRGTKTPAVSHRILPTYGSDHHAVLTRIELQ